MVDTDIKKVLIYRLGSIGDTVVALPAFRLVARAFPNAKLFVLTDNTEGEKEAPMAAVLEGTGLIHGYLEYPRRLRNPRQLAALRRQIYALKPDCVVYLAAPRGRLNAVRDALFFRSCGVSHLIGVPYSKALQRPHELTSGLYESEATRLARTIAQLGDARIDNSESWSLAISALESQAAAREIGVAGSAGAMLAASIGTKLDIKDWGDDNWIALLEKLGLLLNNWGLVMDGAPTERARTQALLRHWPGPTANLCGRLSLRESAAALSLARVFIGHDSGPMHLAAAVGTPCVAIFSARTLPGQWFPHGTFHQVIYHTMPCQGCELNVCHSFANRCMTSISVEEVVHATTQLLRLRSGDEPIAAEASCAKGACPTPSFER